MATTNKMDIPYPASTDLVTDGAADMQALAEEVDKKTGLIKITPTSVPATDGTINADGSVTIGATKSSVTINGCFTSDFDNYLVTLAGGSTSVSNADLNLQLRTSGGSTSATGYYGALVYSTTASANPLAFNNNNGASWINAGASVLTTTPSMWTELLSPNLARRTVIAGRIIRGDAIGTHQGYHDVATAYNSIVIKPTSGTFSDCVVRIYGYN